MKRILGLVMISLIFVSCSQDANNTLLEVGPKSGMLGELCYPSGACDAGLGCDDAGICNRVTELNENTVVITKKEIKDFLEIDYKNRQYVFTKNQRTSKFTVGTILGFPKTKITPTGGVAKITKVTKRGNELIFDVAVPSFAEILGNNAKVEFHAKLNEDRTFSSISPREFFKYSDDKLVDGTTNIPISFSYPDKVNSIIKVNGNIGINYVVSFMIETNKGFTILRDPIKNVKFLGTAKLDNNVKIDLKVDKGVDLYKIPGFDKILGREFGLGSFEKEFKGITINLAASLSARLQPKAELHGEGHLDYVNKDTIKVGFEKLKGQAFKPITEFSMEESNLKTDWNVKGNVNVDLVIEPKVELALAGELDLWFFGGTDVSGGAKIGANITLNLIDAEGEFSGAYNNNNGDSSMDMKLCYKLNGGLVLGAYANANILGGLVNESVGSPNLCEKTWSWLEIFKEGKYLGQCGSGCETGLECKDGLGGVGGKRCYPQNFCSKTPNSQKNICKVFACQTTEDCRAGGNDNLVCKEGKCVENNATTIEYETVSIPAGTFKRGCTAEECPKNDNPVKDVEMSAYKIGKYEVKVSQYKQCVTAGGCDSVEVEQADNLPMTNVNWAQAQNFCSYLGTGWRLATEAEWEYAAKGTSTNYYPWGNQMLSCQYTTMMNYDEDNTCNENNSGKLLAGGSAAQDKSTFGVMDMGGNVSEWTYDNYNSEFYRLNISLKDPMGAVGEDETGENKSVRGGHYSYAVDQLKGTQEDKEITDVGNIFLNYYRGYKNLNTTSKTIGFRCAKSTATQYNAGDNSGDNGDNNGDNGDNNGDNGDNNGNNGDNTVSGDFFNPYILKAVNELNANYRLRGYAAANLTHDIGYGTQGVNNAEHYGTIKRSGGEKTMCVSAVMEVMLTAMRIYANETGDNTVYDFLPRSSFERQNRSNIKGHIWVDHSYSHGTADALKNFGMGNNYNFKELKPGSFVNLNRHNRTGHAVVFLAFLDKDGNEYDSYPEGTEIIGFKYFSSQGRKAVGKGGFDYRWAIFGQGTRPDFCARKRCDRGVIKRFNNQQYLNTGMMWMPSKWVHKSGTKNFKIRDYRLNLEPGLPLSNPNQWDGLTSYDLERGLEIN